MKKIVKTILNDVLATGQVVYFAGGGGGKILLNVFQLLSRYKIRK